MLKSQKPINAPVTVGIKERLRAMAGVLERGHSGISVSYIVALNQAAGMLYLVPDSTDLVNRLHQHAQALATPGGVISLDDLIATINDTADRMPTSFKSAGLQEPSHQR